MISWSALEKGKSSKRPRVVQAWSAHSMWRGRPERMRANVKPGQAARVFVDGRDAELVGSIRMIRSEPSFTPYFALIGEDAARLSYLAEVELGADAARLPAGLPVRVEFDGR